MKQTIGQDKRLHAREPTLQTAHIRFGDGQAILAEIRDYCPTGLYVAFVDGRTPDEAIPALVGTATEVSFARRNVLIHRCNGRVAHISRDGVGIFVPLMPEDALHALRAAAEQGAGGRTTGAPVPLQPQQALSMKQACDRALRAFLDAVLKDFFGQAGERLVQAGCSLPSFLERSRYEYGAQELALSRARIEGDFLGTMREAVQNPESIDMVEARGSGRATLSLVDEAEFEDWLNLAAVIKKIETELAAALEAFEPRYGRLAGVPVGRKNNPFGPEKICRAFQGAIQALEFSNSMRTVLYSEFGRAYARHAPALYESLNQTLSPLQAPEAAAVGGGAPGSAKAPSSALETERAKPDLAEVADTLNTLYAKEQGGQASGTGGGDYSLDHILDTLNQTLARPSTVARPHPARPAGGETADQSADSQVLHVVDRLMTTARQLDRRPSLAPAAVSPAAEGGSPALSVQELLGLLDSLPQVSYTGPAGAPHPSLTEQIDASLAASGATRQLAAAQRQTLNVAAGLFERAHADLTPSSDIEALVRRMERPLLKLALEDARFPNNPEHPARQVVNLIEQYAVAADDAGKLFDAKLKRFLFLLVDRVCSRADKDPGVFESVRDSLEKVLLPILQTRRTRVARLQEASEGRERIRQARARVNAALEARLAGREVPAMLLRLLDAGWRQHLVLLEMRHGQAGPEWQDALAVLDRLLSWLGPEPDARSKAENVQALLGQIEHALVTVNVDGALLTAFVDELAAALAAGAPAAGDRIRVPPGRLAAPGPDGQAFQALADALKVGAWWSLDVNGRTLPMQLIWLSHPTHSCTFANRSATNRVDLTLAELSRQIEKGLANPGKDLDLPLIDRSEQALFDETYQRLASQALHDPVTGLPNRKGFLQQLAKSLPPEGASAHAVGVLEFDQVRLIYNACGVEAVEALARQLADAVRTELGPKGIVAAFRDDTLAILLRDCNREVGCRVIDTLLLRVKDFPFHYGEHRYSIGVSIGLAEFVPAEHAPEEVIRRADSACIAAKTLGRNRMQLYEQATPMLQSQESLTDWAGRIDSYLEGSGLYLRSQLVMPTSPASGLPAYYEILLGIEGTGKREIRPSEFIPAVERLQRAHEVDIWVMSRVFEWIGVNRKRFDSIGGFSINLSAMSLSNPDIRAYLHGVLPSLDFPAEKISFEITESAAIGSYGAAQEFIREIRRYGCKFALDDFGSGFTSYAHLKNLRSDALKIDGSFVKDMLQNPSDYAMVKSMNDIGHSLGLKTVAEYVESPMILEALRQIGVDYAQGYAIHKPCPIVELTRR